MFRHVVMVRLTEDMTDDQKEALRAGLSRLPEVITDIRAYRFGEDARLNEGNFDFVVTADFDDADGYLAYRDHPDHKKLVAELEKKKKEVNRPALHSRLHSKRRPSLHPRFTLGEC